MNCSPWGLFLPVVATDYLIVIDLGPTGGSSFYRDVTWEYYDKHFWDVSHYLPVGNILGPGKYQLNWKL
jgi:hypothetical protein